MLILLGITSENSENIKDKSDAIDFGTDAGIPENSKLKISAFPALSPFTETPQRESGFEKVIFVISDFVIFASPSVLVLPSEKIKSMSAV